MKIIPFLAVFLWSAVSSMAWTPPIGIPSPSWGALGNPIDLVAPTPPANWTQNIPNIYYVEEGGTNPGTGYPGNPCGQIWSELPAGTIVFVKGTITRNHYQFNFRHTGTAAAPVWVLSYDPNNPAVFTSALGIGAVSSYLILENLRWQRTGASGGALEIAGGADHICVRNCSITGPGSEEGTQGENAFNQTTVGILDTGSYGGTEQIVFYKSIFTKGGNWKYATGDPDAHGVAFGPYVQDVWVVDCDFSYFSGNAVQVGAGTTGSTPDSAVSRRIYVGRCTAHHIAQSAFWSKRAEDVIFSQNICHTMRRDTPSSPNSGGLGGQYGPRNLWIIFNHVYNCQSGIIVNSSSLGAGATSTDVYVVGNLLQNIRDGNVPVMENWRNDSFMGNGVCVASWSQSAWVIGNTFYDYNAGILSPGSSLAWKIHGNIFSNRAGTLGTDVNIYDPGGGNVISNNLFTAPYIQDGGSVWQSVASINSAKGPGNIGGTPVFANVGAADFKLQAGSAGIDAAGAAANAVYALFQSRYGSSIAFDRVGIARPQGGVWDIGAFEFGAQELPGSPPAPPLPPTGLKAIPPN